jgi:type IV pilus assembly protein PilY1
LLQKIKTPNASSGLAQASAYVQNFSDYTADSVYVGDLNGQLWRFDLTATTGNYPAPTQIATLTDGSSNPQPVTSAPVIEIHPTTRQRYVMFGTGELLSSGDIGSTQTQTFYAIIDGTSGGFSSVSTPITRSNLTQVTDITAGVIIPANKKGWYFDLPSRYRVTTMPVTFNGIVAFAALVPTTDPCSPQGSSNVYAADYSTGQSVLNPTTTGSTTPAADVAFPNAVTNLKIVQTNGGTPELIAGTTTGAINQVGANLTGTLSTRLLNWREIPTSE